MADFPAPAEGIVLTHFLVSDDVDRSRAFYTEVLGGEALMDGEPTIVALANSWIIINTGGGPTDDKPSITLEAPHDLDRVSAFLNIRVADIAAVYADWSAKGAQFIWDLLTRASALTWSRLVAAPFVIISREAVVMILVRVSSPLTVDRSWPGDPLLPVIPEGTSRGRRQATAECLPMVLDDGLGLVVDDRLHEFVLVGEVVVHLRAADFRRHLDVVQGGARDPAFMDQGGGLLHYSCPGACSLGGELRPVTRLVDHPLILAIF